MANTTTKSIIWLFAQTLNDQYKIIEQRLKLQKDYRKKDTEVERSLRKDKRAETLRRCKTWADDERL